ncbi:MAG: hypothetical protein GY849_21085 [Deltaproteobacteria bacterium]|nr:hypothetical protein [Deltaproteobacteria bacterium]
MTTHKSDAVVAGIMPDFAQAGVVLCRSAEYVTSDDSVVSGDTIQMVPIPKGAKVLKVDVYYSALPAGTTAVDIGYGGDTDAFMSTIPMTADNFQFWPGGSYDNDAAAVGVFLHTFTADDTIDIAIASAATKIPTSQHLYMSVQYKMTGTMDDET